MWIKSACMIAVTAVAVAGCGGGGGGDSRDRPVGPAEGVYDGTDEGGNVTLSTIVLRNDEIWTIRGAYYGNARVVDGLIQGWGRSDNGYFSAREVTEFLYMPEAALTRMSLEAEYRPRDWFSGEYLTDQWYWRFSLAAVPAQRIDYRGELAVEDINGTWPITLADAYAETEGTISINAGVMDGQFADCRLTGSAWRETGRNAFRVDGQFGEACWMGPLHVQGLAYTMALGSNERQLIVMAVDTQRSYGLVAFSTTSVIPEASTGARASATATQTTGPRPFIRRSTQRNQAAQ